MMTREELNTEIVVAITVFRAAKREELVKAVENAWADGAAWNAAPDADKARIAAWGVWKQARAALIAYDKENT